jgi:hypothetical protein
MRRFLARFGSGFLVCRFVRQLVTASIPIGYADAHQGFNWLDWVGAHDSAKVVCVRGYVNRTKNLSGKKSPNLNRTKSALRNADLAGVSHR